MALSINAKRMPTEEKEVTKPVYGARITEIKKDRVLADGSEFIDISFDILLDGEVIADRHLAFDIDATQEEVKAGVTANYKMFEADCASVAEAEARKVQDEATEELVAELTGQEL